MKQLSQYIFEKLHPSKFDQDVSATGFVIKSNKIYKEDNEEENTKFFISFSKIGYGNNTSYTATYTSVKQNNFRRMKVFKTKEAAEQYIESYKDKLYNYDEFKDNIEIIPYDDALDMIGDSDTKNKELKAKQEADRKARRQQRYQNNKEENKKKEEEYSKKDPGEYKVRFPYSNNYFDGMEFTLKAESINDAFEKGKKEALRRDRNCNTPGYDHKVLFTKKYIHKK